MVTQKMGYIRDNEDYYISCGISPEEAAEAAAEDEWGDCFCNPVKIKLAQEDVAASTQDDD